VIAIGESVGPRCRHLGSTGCQPVVVGSLPTNHESPIVLQGRLGLPAFEELFGKAAEKDGLAACAPHSEPIYLGAQMKPCRFSLASFRRRRNFPKIFFTSTVSA
jgi:hypothetical protein